MNRINTLLSNIENESFIDVNLLLDDDNFKKLFKSLINFDDDVVISRCVKYVNENF